MSRVRRPYAVWQDDHDGEIIGLVCWWTHPADIDIHRHDVQYVSVRYRPCKCHRVYIGGVR